MARIKEAWDYGPWAYNVDQARAILAASPRPTVDLDVEPLGTLVVDGLVGVDLLGLREVDPEEPLIVIPNPGKRPPAPQDAALLPIDGWHRVMRAYLEGRPVVRAYPLTADEADGIRFLIPGTHEVHSQTGTN